MSNREKVAPFYCGLCYDDRAVLVWLTKPPTSGDTRDGQRGWCAYCAASVGLQ